MDATEGVRVNHTVRPASLTRRELPANHPLRTYTAFGVHRVYRWVPTALGQRRAGSMSSARWSWLAHQRR